MHNTCNNMSGERDHNSSPRTNDDVDCRSEQNSTSIVATVVSEQPSPLAREDVTICPVGSVPSRKSDTSVTVVENNKNEENIEQHTVPNAQNSNVRDIPCSAPESPSSHIYSLETVPLISEEGDTDVASVFALSTISSASCFSIRPEFPVDSDVETQDLLGDDWTGQPSSD